MPIAYRIDTTQGLTIGVWHGTLTSEHIETATAKLLSDPAWPPPGRKHLTDLTSVTATPDLTRLAEIHKASGQVHGIRLAAIASEGFEQARKYEQAVASAGLNVIVFNQAATACAWLGIDYAATQKTIDELRQELRANLDDPN